MPPTVVKRVKYPGTLDQFRGLMQRLRDRRREGLAVADGQQLSFCEERQQRFHLRPDATWDPRGVPPDVVERVEDVTPPSRGTWRIERLGPDGQPDMWCGYMQAYESPSGVLVEFALVEMPPSNRDAASSLLLEFAKQIMGEAAYAGDTCSVLQLQATSGKAEGPDETPTIESRIEDVATMKRYHKTYSVQTARKILAAIPIAHDKWSRNQLDQWGPDAIRKYGKVKRSAATISRYLGAFGQAGIEQVDGVSIPHRFRSTDHKTQ